MTERLTVRTGAPLAFVVLSLLASGTTATATTNGDHGRVTGEYVTIAGATPAGYNGKVKILSVPSASSFTYHLATTLASPATGQITSTYASNAQGVTVVTWRTIAENVWAAMEAISAQERLQNAAIQSSALYRFRIYTNWAITEQMRVEWTPQFPAGAPVQELTITGILPVDDGRTFQRLEVARVTA